MKVIYNKEKHLNLHNKSEYPFRKYIDMSKTLIDKLADRHKIKKRNIMKSVEVDGYIIGECYYLWNVKTYEFIYNKKNNTMLSWIQTK